LVLLRIVAWLLFVGAVVAAGLDGLGWLESGLYSPIPVIDVWAAVERDVLVRLEPAISAHLHPAVWSSVVFPVLQAPAWLAATLAGGALWLVARPRLPRRRRRPDWR
jgi:hypothetical protein